MSANGKALSRERARREYSEYVNYK